MRYVLQLILWIVLSFLSGCSGKNTQPDIVKNDLQPTFLSDKNSTNPEILGVWKSIGNGYYLEVRTDSLLLYSYTKSFCYKEKNAYLEGLLNSESQFVLLRDTLELYLTDFGDQTKILQTKKDFVKVDRLPENQIGFSEQNTLSNAQRFQLYLENLQENYAFPLERDLDWNTLYQKYKDSLGSDDEMLFATMGKVATLTKDQHTKVIAPDGKTLQYRITPTAETVREVFGQQAEITDLNQYFNQFFATNYSNISDSLLLGKGKKAANGKLEYGHLTKSVGYLHIHSFAGYLEKGYTRRQQIDSLSAQMQNIITTFKDTEALIIDVSFNFGGYDATALTIAGYFTETPVFSHKSQVYWKGRFYEEDEVVIYPAATTAFTKPVYLLTTDISRSAAEGFAMMMRALPKVKLIGTKTLGTLSGMLGKSIGDFYTTYSNQRLVDSNGEFFEVSGVPPDIERVVFRKENIFHSHKRTVRDIVKMIEAR
ncbi:MAG: S41 family peptidase [Bacteroidota bacterium]